jgi:prepilin-type N-terminal cleavage/methylation domain-containing protein
VGKNAPRRAGFTLTELLVVSAVISVLAGLLLPVLGRAREKARQAVCVGNLRQIGQAALMYADDCGRLPTSSAYGYVLWNGTDYVLYGRLVPVCGPGLAKSFFCPSADAFTMNSPATGLQNLGVPGKTTAGGYYVRSLGQGAPVDENGARQALLADVVGNHHGGVHVLYTDSSVRFIPAPINLDLSSATAWSQLDGGTVTVLP